MGWWDWLVGFVVLLAAGIFSWVVVRTIRARRKKADPERHQELARTIVESVVFWNGALRGSGFPALRVGGRSTLVEAADMAAERLLQDFRPRRPAACRILAELAFVIHQNVCEEKGAETAYEVIWTIAYIYGRWKLLAPKEHARSAIIAALLSPTAADAQTVQAIRDSMG